MPPADAPGFCKEICRFQRPKSGAVNAKTKSILAFTITTHFRSSVFPTAALFFLCDATASRSEKRLAVRKYILRENV